MNILYCNLKPLNPSTFHSLMCVLAVYITLLLTSLKHFESPSLVQFHNKRFTGIVKVICELYY